VCLPPTLCADSRHVVDGKWKDSRILMDNLGLLQQLGALPAAPPNNAT
jgi:hypothetical protein